MKETNKQIIIKRLPKGIPREDDFALSESAIPDISEGMFLARNLILSLDPYVRAVMSGRHFYNSPKPGDIMRARAVAQIQASRHPRFKEGDVIVLESGLQEYCVSDGDDVHFADTGTAPLSAAVGILGMPGLTAYAALTHSASLKKSDTVLVSAASGAVGCMVGQISRIKGARVIGIAGSDEKCEWCIQNAGFNYCLNRKTDDLNGALNRVAPEGVDIFFDNTGGDIQNLVMTRHLALNSRIILSGLITQYNLDTAPPGPNLGNITKMRATVSGFVVYDFEYLRDEFTQEAVGWFKAGRLSFKEDVTEGIETAPAQFVKLMKGQNFGKTLVKLADKM